MPFRAGNFKRFNENWENLTSNPWVLNIIKPGLKLDFIGPPEQNVYRQLSLSVEERLIIDKEIDKLLDKKVVYICFKTRNRRIHLKSLY